MATRAERIATTVAHTTGPTQQRHRLRPPSRRVAGEGVALSLRPPIRLPVVGNPRALLQRRCRWRDKSYDLRGRAHPGIQAASTPGRARSAPAGATPE